MKIKSFLGTSKNAVLTQIWVAMSYYLLLTYIKYQTKCGHSLLTLSRIIREMLFERKNLIDILTLKPDRLRVIQDEPLQGALFLPDTTETEYRVRSLVLQNLVLQNIEKM